MACHSIINPAGYSLGNYDSVGRYITTERRPYYDSSTNAWKEYLNPADSSTTLFINGQTYNINNLEDFVNAIRAGVSSNPEFRLTTDSVHPNSIGAHVFALSVLAALGFAGLGDSGK